MAPFLWLIDKLYAMAEKEIKGGELTNQQIEEDLKAKGVKEQRGGYRGMQDTGDNKLRSKGTEVQKRDGLQEDKEEG
jgi:hypothetical protein